MAGTRAAERRPALILAWLFGRDRNDSPRNPTLHNPNNSGYTGSGPVILRSSGKWNNRLDLPQIGHSPRIVRRGWRR